MPTVYLAGPISGCSFNGCTEWRQDVKARLEPMYTVLSPMRGKEALSHIECFTQHGYDGVCSDQNIYRRDKYDVHRSDVIFVNLLGTSRVSIGTMFEIAWAERAGKFVLVCLEAGSCHDHAFVLQAASMVVPTVDDAVAYLTKVLNA